MLTSDRGRFQEQALERLRQRCGDYGDKGMGIRLEGLDLHDLHPPHDVVAAYHDVTRAMEKRDLLINRGEEKVLRDERRQQAEGLKQVREAEAESQKKILFAQANRTAFEGRYRLRHRLALAEEWRLFARRLERDEQGPACRRGGRGVSAPPRGSIDAATGVDGFPHLLGVAVRRPG